MKPSLWALSVFAVVATVSVHATPVTWNLLGAALDDGGTASGSFVYDADTNLFSEVDITTTLGPIRVGSTYTSATSIANATTADFIEPALPVIEGTSERLVFFLDSAMTNSGGSIAILLVREFTCLDFSCTFVTGSEPGLNLRSALPGSFDGSISTSAVTPAPEPATLALLGLGIAGIGLARRRKLN